MPIRFRCAYCNQLMGIATRKAGTVVRCPNCAGQVIVPNPDGAAPVPQQQPIHQPASQAPVFEGSDFDKLFEPNTVGAPSAPNPMPMPIPQPVYAPPMAPTGFDVEPVPMTGYQGPGIFLTPVKLTILSVGMVTLLGVAFFLGFLVGRP